MQKSEKNHELIIQILLNEYNQSNERIESFLNRQDNILQITLLIIGGAIAFTLQNQIAEEFLVIIPFITLIVFVQILYHYSRAISNQGYREYLLEQINKYLPEDSGIKYSYISKFYLLGTNPMAKVNTIFFPFIMIFTIFYSVIMSNYNILVLSVNIFILILTIYIAFLFYNFTKDLNERVKNYCKDHRKNPTLNSHS